MHVVDAKRQRMVGDSPGASLDPSPEVCPVELAAMAAVQAARVEGPAEPAERGESVESVVLVEEAGVRLRREGARRGCGGPWGMPVLLGRYQDIAGIMLG